MILEQLLLQGATILLTAAATSLLTLLLVRRAIRRRYVPEVRREIDVVLERLGDTVEERVRKGVVDAIKSLPSPDIVRWTRDTVSEAAGELVRGGLSSLLGDGPPPKDPEPSK